MPKHETPRHIHESPPRIRVAGFLVRRERQSAEQRLDDVSNALYHPVSRGKSLWRDLAMRTSRPVTVTLGALRARVDARVRSGAYNSVSEVVRAGLQALDREEASLQSTLRERVCEALDDPRSAIPADQVFAELRAHHADRLTVSERGDA